MNRATFLENDDESNAFAGSAPFDKFPRERRDRTNAFRGFSFHDRVPSSSISQTPCAYGILVDFQTFREHDPGRGTDKSETETIKKKRRGGGEKKETKRNSDPQRVRPERAKGYLRQRGEIPRGFARRQERRRYSR